MFGDMSHSQLNEKMDWLTMFTIRQDRKSAFGQDIRTFIVIVSLSHNSLMVEIEPDHTRIWNDRTSGHQIQNAVDCTQLYKNLVEIQWPKDGKMQGELISMTELCSRFANKSTANLLLFQAGFARLSREFDTEKLSDPAYLNALAQLNERPGLQRIIYTAKYDS